MSDNTCSSHFQNIISKIDIMTLLYTDREWQVEGRRLE